MVKSKQANTLSDSSVPSFAISVPRTFWRYSIFPPRFCAVSRGSEAFIDWYRNQIKVNSFIPIKVHCVTPPTRIRANIICFRGFDWYRNPYRNHLTHPLQRSHPYFLLIIGIRLWDVMTRNGNGGRTTGGDRRTDLQWIISESSGIIDDKNELLVFYFLLRTVEIISHNESR